MDVGQQREGVGVAVAVANELLLSTRCMVTEAKHLRPDVNHQSSFVLRLSVKHPDSRRKARREESLSSTISNDVMQQSKS